MSLKRLTAAAWDGSRQPVEMVLGVRERNQRVSAARRTTERKLRLFGVACCRRLWPSLSAGERRTVEQAERACDGGRPVHRQFQIADYFGLVVELLGHRREAARLTTEALLIDDPITAAMHACQWALCVDSCPAFEGSERPAQADLLRCIVGNPFRPAACGQAWLTATVVGLADGIYTDRGFDRLPVLADALEEAGCDHPDVLAHCRGPGPHARGCWVVDLLLGKA